MGEPYPRNGRQRCRPLCNVMLAVGLATVFATGAAGDPCIVPDDGSGTVSLPPVGCAYLSPDEVHMIIDGLPPGTEIILDTIHLDFICEGNPNHCGNPGGNLGGEIEFFNSTLQLDIQGTGDLAGFQRNIQLQNVFCESHTGPRNPTDTVQNFPNEMVQLQGQLFGDPDFDFLTITAGAANGLPSPGNTTLTRLPSGDFTVDSFFDIAYRIDFQGAPGSVLDGLAGSTTGTIQMRAGEPFDSTVQPGEDHWTTVQPTNIVFGDGGSTEPSIPPIPAGFFDPGSLPFEGTVQLRGVPLDPASSDTDTIVRRLAPADLPDVPSGATIPIEMVAMQLQSIQPIFIEISPDFPADSFFDVYVTIVQDQPSTGQMTISRNSAEGGVFTSQLNVHPRISFIPVGGGPEFVLPNPGPIVLENTLNPHPWCYDAAFGAVPQAGPNFFPKPPPLTEEEPDGSQHTVLPGTKTFQMEFSVDIGGDTELSDPNMDGDEGFDPGDVYLWVGPPVASPGRDGFKNDRRLFTSNMDPNPTPPDLASGAPVGMCGPDCEQACYGNFFDLDGHDQLDQSLIGVIDPNTPLAAPIPRSDFQSQCIYDPRFLAISYDDDGAPGWPLGDVPVTAASPAGLTYGTALLRDEVLSVGLAPGFPPLGVGAIAPFADEVGVHGSLGPNPVPGAEADDDDVDSLDFVISTDQGGSCPLWFFSPDHEAHRFLDPGGIYENVGLGSVQVIDEIHLGIPEETDVDAFEFAWIPNQANPGGVLGVIYSVDEDDPCTPGDESGGLNPNMIYASVLTGFSFPLLTTPLDDDVDAISLWCQVLQPQPTGACCIDDPPLGCIITTAGDCATRPGVYQGDGTTCDDLDGNMIPDACEPECVPNADGSACEPFMCPTVGAVEDCLPTCIRFDPSTGAQTIVDCDCVDPNNQCFADFGPVEPICSDTCPPGQQCVRTETIVDPTTGLRDVCCSCEDDPVTLCPEPPGDTICASRQSTDCVEDASGQLCRPLCIGIEGTPGMVTAVANLCDCVDDTTCGPIDVMQTGPNEYSFRCIGDDCPPGSDCTVHEGIGGVFTGTGNDFLTVTNPDPDTEYKCMCEDDPPPPVCPLPQNSNICASLQTTECLNGAANDFCLPTCVRMVDDGTGTGPQPTAEACECIEPGPTCGPVRVSPIAGTTFSNLSCSGQDCPPGEICQIHINGVAQGVTNIDSNQVNDGDEVKCNCSGDPGPVCPEPNNLGICAPLQMQDCQPDATSDVCLPQCVQVVPGPVGPIVTATVCDCYPEELPCDPVQVRRIPGTPDVELFCEGDCPPGAKCEITVNGVAQGTSVINANAVQPDSEVKCECIDEPPPIGACCFDADGDGVSESCAVITSADCTAHMGTFHGVGTTCGVVGSCCYDTDGDGVQESCDVMDSTCCEDLNGTFNGAGSVCLGDGNGNNIDDACDCDQLTTRRLILRSGNGTVGGIDANIHVWSGAAGAPLSAAAFNTQDFRRACKRPEADIVNPLAVYLPGSAGLLPADPFAQWIAIDQFLTPASQLYCYEFDVCCPNAALSNATIEFAFAGDDRLGDPAGGPNPIGVFINNVPVPGHSAVGFATQTVFPTTPITLNSGSNTMHVYLRDVGFVASAAIFSATIEYECRPEACCFPDGTCDDIDPCCCRDLGGTPQGAGTDCATVDCPQPDCEPLPGGLDCAPFDCPDPEECIPSCLSFNPETGDLRIKDCDCREDNTCHPEIVGGLLRCVGDCPPGETCVESLVIDPATGEQTLCCDCEPAPACEPIPGTPFCEPFNCPDPTDQCRTKCVQFNPLNGAVDALDCDCLGEDDCYAEVPSDGTRPFCVDNCPPGETCRESVSIDPNTGIEKICCECVPDPEQCEPLPDNSACSPTVCPDPMDVCVPRCIEQHPVFGTLVVDCECRDPEECRPVPSSVNPPQPPTCEGLCPPGETCIRTRTFDPLTGAVTICCDCERVCPLPDDPAVDPCAALQATDCVLDAGANGRCRPRFVSVMGGVPVVVQCDCADPEDTCGPIGIDANVVFCPGACPAPQQGECLVHANGVSLGANSVTVSGNLEGSVLTCECANPPVVGACCFDADGDTLNESCSVILQSDCEAIGGAFGGAGSTCGVSGACCIDRDMDGVNDDCVAADSTCCADLGGDFQGAGTTCQGDANGNGIDDVCDCDLDDAGTVITLRSGNGIIGAPDAEITMLAGPGGAPLSAAAFTAADFAASCAGPPARIINPIAAWLPGSFGVLPADPSALWIGLNPSRSPASILYCHEFEVCCPDPLSARIEFAFAADDRIGDPPGGPNPIGVYMNGAPVPGFTGGGFGAQTILGPAPVSVTTGTNQMHVYMRDQFAVVSGLIYSAEVTVQCALEACCLPDGTCEDLDPCCCRDLGGTPQGSGSDCTTADCGGGPTCVRDCDCYIDGIANGTPPDVCDYTYCDNGQCVSCQRRHGNTCSSFAGIVQTNDILCAVSGFGNYCACPNADVWDSSGAGCSMATPANCKGPSGVPIGTADILAIVAAFGGANPFNCPVPPANGGCDASPPPPADGCGPAAASDGELPALDDNKRTIGSNDNAQFLIVPRQRAVKSGENIVVDVYVTNASGVVGFEYGLNAALVGRSAQRLALESISVDTQRGDYIFDGLYNFPALDEELGRVGGALHGSGVEVLAGKRAYVGTFTFGVPTDAVGVVNIAAATEYVGLWANGSVQVSANAGKDAAVLIVAPERSRR